jgi:hypothetical protein
MLIGAGAWVVHAAPPSSALTVITSAPTEAGLVAAFNTANTTDDDVEIDVIGGAGVTVNLTTTPFFPFPGLFYNGGGGVGGHSLTFKGGGVTVNQTLANSGVFVSAGPGSLTLDGVTITGGNYTSSVFSGAAVFTINGPLILSNATVRNNTDITGVGQAAIIEAGQLFSEPVTLTNVTVDSNTATASGGAADFGIVTGMSATITNSRVTNNTDAVSANSPAGGTIDAGPDPSTITNSTFSGNVNSATGSGEAFGILNIADTTVAGSSFTGNQTSSVNDVADGTLFPEGLTMSNSMVENNTVTSPVQAFAAVSPTPGLAPATTTVTGSTIDHNTTISPGGTASGGGVATTEPLGITNSTITNNTATGSVSNGGGIDQDPDPSNLSKAAQGTVGYWKRPVGVRAQQQSATGVTLVYTTVVDNTASSGANLQVSSLATFGTVVASPHGSANCTISGTVTSDGYNFSDDASCTLTTTGDHQNAGDPKLASLANAGGPTPTRVPQDNSLLIDAIPVASCQADVAAGVTTGQRGVTRPQGLGCDIGAVEVIPTPILVTPKFTG